MNEPIPAAMQAWLLRGLMDQLIRSGLVDPQALSEWLSLQKPTPDPASGLGLELAKQWVWDAYTKPPVRK